MDAKVVGAIVTGVATVTAAVLIAIFQFVAKMREERRLARVAAADADARIAASFVSLMSKAHARGESVISEGAAAALLAEGPLVETLRTALAAQVTDSSNAVQLKTIDNMLDLLHLRVHHVGGAEQEAAMQAVVALGLQHSVLTPAALEGLEGRHAYHPVRNYTSAVEALNARAAHDARRFRFQKPDRPSYWLRQYGQSREGTRSA